MILRGKRILRTEKLILVYFGFFICTYTNLFLMWGSYGSLIISSIFKLLQHSLAIGLFLYSFVYGQYRRKIQLHYFICILVCLLLCIHINFLGSDYYYSNILSCVEVILVLMALLNITSQRNVELFEIVFIVFVVITLPSLIYYILYSIGFDIPYSILSSDHAGKVEKGIWYMHYPFGLISMETSGRTRLTGVYDEAGMVGTMAAVLFAAGYKRIDKKWLILLLIEGIMSTSMAFYFLLLVFIVSRSFINGAFKFATAVLVVILAVGVFINIDFHNDSIAAIQSRIDLSSSILVTDNRTNESFDVAYSNFLNEGGYSLFMGKGGLLAYAKNPEMFGANSYKCLIYDIGIVGFIEYISFFLVLTISLSKNKEVIPFALVFFASIYQRAYVFKASWVAIFILALVYISTKEVNGNGKII